MAREETEEPAEMLEKLLAAQTLLLSKGSTSTVLAEMVHPLTINA